MLAPAMPTGTAPNAVSMSPMVFDGVRILRPWRSSKVRIGLPLVWIKGGVGQWNTKGCTSLYSSLSHLP